MYYWPVSQDDELSAYLSNKYMTRIVTMEKTFIDLMLFNQQGLAWSPLVAMRLPFTSKLIN